MVNTKNITKFSNPFLQHILTIWFKDNTIECQWFLQLIAWELQNVEKKSLVVPIIFGKPGCGKSIVAEALSKMWG